MASRGSTNVAPGRTVTAAAVSEATLLEQMGGYNALVTVIKNWYHKISETSIRIDENLIDSIIDLQCATLENVLLDADESDVDIHTVHQKNDISLKEEEEKTITQLFKDALRVLGLPQALEKKIRDRCCATRWLNLDMRGNGSQISYGITGRQGDLLKKNMELFIKAAGNENNAGNLLMEAIWGLGELKKLFKMPARVFSFRFISQLNRLAKQANDQENLTKEVYDLAMRHISYISVDVGKDWVEMILEAVIRVISGAIEDVWTNTCKETWQTFLGYIGSVVFTHMNTLSAKVNLIISSWNKIAMQASTSLTQSVNEAAGTDQSTGAAKRKKNQQQSGRQEVLTNSEVHLVFGQSFFFNVEVMGVVLAGRLSRDKDIISELFGEFIGKLVVNICDVEQVEEEIYLLSLRHLEYITSADLVHVPVFSGSFVVTLRSLLPRDWNKEHEEAWGWLWDRTVKLFTEACDNAIHAREKIDNTMDVLAKHDMEDLCQKFCNKWINADEVNGYFDKPSGIFKFILLRIIYLVSTIYHDPREISKEARALGLRHVKYSPPEALLPLMTSAILHTLSVDLQGYWNEDIEFAWRNPFRYIEKTIARAMRTGTNLVTQCCKTNNVTELASVVATAPRGERNMWLLETRAIGSTLSPFYWVMYEAKIEMLQFMIDEVTVIRADREAYYCGLDELFESHPGVIANLAIFSADSMGRLFDGMVWVSRNATNGKRRVNYYVRHIYGDPTLARFADPYKTPLASLTNLHKVDIFLHPVTQFLIHLKWDSFAKWQYVRAIIPYMVMMVSFVVGNVGTVHADTGLPEPGVQEIVSVVFRGIQFAASLFILFVTQIPRILREIERKQTNQVNLFCCNVRLPYFLTDWSNISKLLLNIFVIVGAITDGVVHHSLEEWAGGVNSTRKIHHWMVSLAAILFITQIFDLYALGVSTAKFRLQFNVMLPEVLPFAAVLAFLYCGFGASMSVSTLVIDEYLEKHHMTADDLHHMPWMMEKLEGFSEFGLAFENLICTSLSNFEYDWADLDPLGRVIWAIFIGLSMFFLMNLISGSASSCVFHTSKNAEGLTYRQQARDVVELETVITREERESLFHQCGFADRIEFDFGDLGIAGGIQVEEAVAARHYTSDRIDRVFRFAGEANAYMPWAEDQLGAGSDERLKMHNLITGLSTKLQRTYKLMKGIIKKAKSNSGKGMVSQGQSEISGESQSIGSDD